jgi:hypothetical protein
LENHTGYILEMTNRRTKNRKKYENNAKSDDQRKKGGL